MTTQAERGRTDIRVLRIIARLNVGGPAIQAISLTRLLRSRGYDTTLLRGAEGPREGSMDYLAESMGVQPVRVPGLQRGVGFHDIRALASVMRWIHRVRPDVLHTHTAKAGSLGRIAVILMPWARPRVVVHTFHGHVLKGEFSPRVVRVIALVERVLARWSTRLIAVSQQIKDDLVEFGVASPSKIDVVHLGFDLSRFVDDSDRPGVRQAVRERLGIPQDARVVTLIARVVKVKRVDRFLEMADQLSDRDDVWFLIAGDGDKRPELEAAHPGERTVWAGFETDIRAICFASDVVALTSDNEGTPVCLIEAQAAAVPVVTTEVGGVRTVVRDGESGRVVGTDASQLAAAVGALLDDERLRLEWGSAGRAHALRSFGVERLVADIEELYRRELSGGASRESHPESGRDARRMKVAAFGPVGPLAPSWRVRVLLPRRGLAEAGIDVEPLPFFSQAEARAFEHAGPLKRARLILRARRQLRERVAGLDDAANTVFVQRHVDMASPLTWERRVADGRRLVLDIDDAIWLTAPREAGAHRLAFLKRARRKVEFLAGTADAVIAGNEFLADWLSEYSSNVVVVPSLVDPSTVPARKHVAEREVTWGWIGSRSTTQHLDEAASTLAKAAAGLPGQSVRLLVLGASRPIRVAGLEVEHRSWSEEAERHALNEVDIGLMPLPDNPWTRGKCAYKALLYMSAGIPVVADDVGVSRRTVGHEEGGLIAESAGQWIENLRVLTTDVEQRRRLGNGARNRAEDHFSIARWTSTLASTIRGDAG